jgi:hypothetical protein
MREDSSFSSFFGSINAKYFAFFWVKFTYLFLAQPLSYLSHSRYVVCSEGLKEMASKALQNRDVVKKDGLMDSP